MLLTASQINFKRNLMFIFSTIKCVHKKTVIIRRILRCVRFRHSISLHTMAFGVVNCTTLRKSTDAEC